MWMVPEILRHCLSMGNDFMGTHSASSVLTRRGRAGFADADIPTA
jgi:hypothetical protein